MLSLTQILLIVIIILVLIFLSLLFCAIDIIIDLKKTGTDTTGTINIKWLFLSYSKVLPHNKSSKINDIKDENKSHNKSEINSQESKKEDQKNNLSVQEYLQILRNIRIPLFNFLKQILKAIKLHSGELDLRLGVLDPADTGILIGILFSIFGIIKQYWSRFSYYIEPKFDDNVLDLILLLDVRLRIYRFIYPIFRLVLNRNILKSGWLLLRNFR